MFANIERHQSKHSIGGSTSREREREREMRVFFLNFARFFCSGNPSTYFKVCVDLCKKSDRTRCLEVSILENNINWKGRTKQCSDSSVVRGE